MLREVNDKPIRLKHVFIPNTDWRVHADAASKSFRIEKRQGEKWTVLSSFLVSIAEIERMKGAGIFGGKKMKPQPAPIGPGDLLGLSEESHE